MINLLGNLKIVIRRETQDPSKKETTRQPQQEISAWDKIAWNEDPKITTRNRKTENEKNGIIRRQSFASSSK